MDGGFDATALERGYAFLDECPDRLLETAIILPIGDLRQRVHGIRAWRDALLDGRLPSADVWPPAEVAAPVRHALDTMGIVRFCRIGRSWSTNFLTTFSMPFPARTRRFARRSRNGCVSWRRSNAFRPSSVRTSNVKPRGWRNGGERVPSAPRTFTVIFKNYSGKIYKNV